MSRFTDDPELIEHILLFEKLIPKYELITDEITTEDNRVIVKARACGKHTGETEVATNLTDYPDASLFQ